MCHTIESEIRFLCYTIDDSRYGFVGMKQLHITEGGRIITPLTRDIIIEDTNGFWTVEHPVGKQNLDAALIGLHPSDKGMVCKYISTSIMGGIHISPSLVKENKFSEGRDSFDLIGAYVSKFNAELGELVCRIPVLFHLDDVVFFDGQDVSVEWFKPLNSHMIEHLRKDFPELSFNIWEVALSEWEKEIENIEIPGEY